VIRSVAAIEASRAGTPAAGQLTLRKSGHLNLAKSGHYNLASTIKSVDKLCYVKSVRRLAHSDYPRRLHEFVPACLQNVVPSPKTGIEACRRRILVALGRTAHRRMTLRTGSIGKTRLGARGTIWSTAVWWTNAAVRIRKLMLAARCKQCLSRDPAKASV
jgi:hypothetical protein